MALIANNISGSASNSSRIGLTGSVIFANAPGSSFPSAPNGVTFFVSGSSTAIGADSPSIVFKGDTFTSGAFGVSDYIQMKPVGTLRIPTNTSASYIYTSGSTNDLYFTQYQPGTGYTNTTRLRWLEGSLGTGLLHGGTLSTQAGTTTFTIQSGSAITMVYNASTANEPYPVINHVTWPTYLSQSLTYSASAPITFIGINSSGGIIQRTTAFSGEDYLNYISLGRILHESGSVTNGAVTNPSTGYGVSAQHSHFVRAFGSLKISGHTLAASGSTLSITKTSGDSYAEGRNYTVNSDNPNYITSVTDTAVTVSKIFREYMSGSSYRVDSGVGNAGYTAIDPSLYNLDGLGTLSAVSAGQYTIQRVYWFPNSATRAFYVYYGNATYNSLDTAQAAIDTETFTEGENTRTSAILVGYILVKGNATDLSNTTQARIIQAGLFRGGSLGGGGGGAGSTTPGGLDTYVQFNDGGSTFGGDAELTYNKTTNVLTVGDVSVGDSGLISTAGTTATVFNTSATTVNFAGAATTLNIGNSTGTNTVSGQTKFSQGLSGSLTKLSDGTSYLIAGSNMSITTGSTGAVTIGSTGVAQSSSAFVTIGNDSGLSAERALTAGTGIRVTDAGANSTVTLAIDDSIVATVSGTTFTGDIAVNGGDITSTSATFNLIDSGVTTLNIGRSTSSAINIGTTPATTNTITIGKNDATNGTTLNLYGGASGVGAVNMETSGGAIYLGNSAFARAVNIGTGAALQNVLIGSKSGNSTTTLQAGTGTSTGNLLLSGAVGTTYTLGGETGTGTITLGRSTASNTINVGAAMTVGAGTEAQTINIGTGVGRNVVSIGSTGSNALVGGGSVTITAGPSPGSVSLTGTTDTTYSIGSPTTTGTITIGGATQQGKITLGQSTASNTIDIGNSGNNLARTQTVNIAAGTSISAVTIGSTTGADTLILGQTSNNCVINVGTGTTATGNTQDVNIANSATGTGRARVAIGNTNANSTLGLYAGATGTLTIDGGTGTTFNVGASTTTGTISIGGTSQTGTIKLGQSTSSNSISIGDGAVGAGGIQTITMGSGASAGSALITIGSISGASVTTVRGITVTISHGTSGTGTLTVGNSTSGNSIVVGNAAVTGTQTIQMGTGATGASGASAISIGSTNAGSALTLSAGVGGVILSSGATGNIVVGNAATSGQITIGATGQTGTITLGQSTDSNSINIGNAVTASTKTQNINIGNSTASGGTTNINIGASVDGTNTITIGKFGSGTVKVLIGGDQIAFFRQTTGVARATVSGAKGSNAALGSLITALANYGLIVDSTTA